MQGASPRQPVHNSAGRVGWPGPVLAQEWAQYPGSPACQPIWLRPIWQHYEAALVVGAAQEPGTAPGAVQASGTPPGAPTGVAPGVVPGTEPGVVPGAAREPKASLGPLADKQVAPGSTAGARSSLASRHMGTEIPECFKWGNIVPKIMSNFRPKFIQRANASHFFHHQ